MLSRRLILIALLGILSLSAAAQVKLTGTVSEWYGGTPTQTPKKRALAGVTAVAGANLDYNTAQSGADRIRGTVAAKASTDEKGNYTLNLPAGNYTVVNWKAGYTPQTDSRVRAPGSHDVEISADKSGHGLHKTVEFAARSGEIQTKKGSDLACDPSGLFASGHGFFKPIPALNTGALIGRIVADEASAPFPIGKGRVIQTAFAGRLQVGINDDNVRDNRGSFRVWILTR